MANTITDATVLHAIAWLQKHRPELGENCEPHVPVNMEFVTRDEFYAVMGRRDVHPQPGPHHTAWIDRDRRAVVGWTWPGLKNSIDGATRLWAIRK